MQNTPNFNLQAWKALQIVCVLGSYSSMAPPHPTSSFPGIVLEEESSIRTTNTEKSKKLFLGESILPTWNKNRDQKVFP